MFPLEGLPRLLGKSLPRCTTTSSHRELAVVEVIEIKLSVTNNTVRQTLVVKRPMFWPKKLSPLYNVTSRHRQLAVVEVSEIKLYDNKYTVKRPTFRPKRLSQPLGESPLYKDAADDGEGS